jgi:hypothetical protein
MMVFGWRLLSLSTSYVSRPYLPAIPLTVSPRATVYSAGADAWAGRKAAGKVVETAAAGMIDAVAAAAWALTAAARVAGMARGRGSAVAGWARAKDDKTTAGSAAVVAAIKGRLGLGERDIVMEGILFSTAGAWVMPL